MQMFTNVWFMYKILIFLIFVISYWQDIRVAASRQIYFIPDYDPPPPPICSV